ncbi:MAG: GHKL domain-containing protein [Halobacteriovoraceae bacterium]|nr:GHKL domain-containing protein [Halobacteriovoraceae bacterium]
METQEENYDKTRFITKTISLALCFMAIIFMVFYYLNSMFFTAKLIAFIFIFFLIAYFISRTRYFLISKFLNIFAFAIGAFINTLTIDNSVTDIFYGIILFPLILFDYNREKKYIFIITPILIFLRVSLELDIFELQVYETIPQNVANSLPIIIPVLTILTILLAGFRFSKETARSENYFNNHNHLLAKLKNKFLTILESSQTGIIQMDHLGKISYINRAGKISLQSNSDECHIEDFLPTNDCQIILEKLNAHNKSFSFESLLLKKSNGELFPASLQISPVIEPESNFANQDLVLLFQDITERLELEKKLKEQQVINIETEKMAALGRLLAGIAHEIKNPLNFILNFSELLKDKIKEESQVEQGVKSELLHLSQLIIEYGVRTNEIINNMLFHASNNQEDKEKVELNNLAINAFKFYQQGLNSKQDIVTVEFNFERDNKDIFILTFPQNLSRSIINLLDNAYYTVEKKYHSQNTKDYQPKITLKLTSNKENIILAIEDNGEGIDSHTRSNIFSPFYTTKPTGEGTGLGLSMVSECIRCENNGIIDVNSQINKGSTFTMTLPRIY